MILTVSFGSKALTAAIQTLVRSFVSVNSHVNQEVRFLIECFSAAWMRACMRLQPTVLFQMLIKTELAGEHFFTSIYRTIVQTAQGFCRPVCKITSNVTIELIVFV